MRKEKYIFKNTPELRKLVALANYTRPQMPKRGETVNPKTVAVIVFYRTQEKGAGFTYLPGQLSNADYHYVKPENDYKGIEDLDVCVGCQLDQIMTDSILNQEIAQLNITVTGNYIQMDAMKNMPKV